MRGPAGVGQSRLSRIGFGGLRARTWSRVTGYAVAVSYNAEVYVFAVQTTTSHEVYDALDLEQWRFWVTSAAVVAESGQDQIGLARVQELCGDSGRAPGRSRQGSRNRSHGA